MGTKHKQRNRQRRREKAAKRRADQVRRRSAQRRTGGGRDGWADASDPFIPPGVGSAVERVRVALLRAADVCRCGRCAGANDRDVVAAIDELQRAPIGLVAAEAETQLGWAVSMLWQEGWQPAELARHARRRDATVGRIVTTAIAADHAPRGRATLHPLWAAQAEALTVGDCSRGWLRALLRREQPISAEAVLTVVAALELCLGAGSLPTILPPPGSDPATWGHDRQAVTDDPMLAKVRALLAQAESTTYEAEAEACTAKAQELMARYAIDSAVVWSQSERKDRPIAIRLPIDDPYAEQKALLLHVVAEHSQCRMVTHAGLGLHSIVGFAADVAATELLLTSLLVQSQAALQAEAAGAPPGSRVRSRAFRSSFLGAYAHRIGQRLGEVNRVVREGAEAELDRPSLLPVLAARGDAIDREIGAMFGELRLSSFRGGSDWLGRARGVLAADRAELNPSVSAADPPWQDAPDQAIGAAPQALF